MALEYIIGPVLALLLGMKFTHYTNTKVEESLKATTARIEKCEQAIAESEVNTLKKTIVTFQPVVKAVRQLQDEIGVQ
jgi:hypothetical protein